MSNMSLVRVRDVMHSGCIMIDGLTTVADALQLMKTQNAQLLIIKKRSQDDEYGLVLLSDIAKKVLAANKAPERVNVYEIMSKPVLSVKPDMQVRYCAQLFHRFGLAMAPVIDSADEVLGFVSYEELVLKGLA
ncbi:CBS domain-containing protein [Marinospirillum sp. MEB164]|uniref:CBS domain-containing protein n=1 Tax=Marinospirillum alkalitolerans TaxID=3123374 RepID=A0ABW8PWQ0_9GAMM